MNNLKFYYKILTSKHGFEFIVIYRDTSETEMLGQIFPDEEIRMWFSPMNNKAKIKISCYEESSDVWVKGFDTIDEAKQFFESIFE